VVVKQREDRGYQLCPRGSARTADSARTTKFRAADADLAQTRLMKILKK